MMEVFKQLLNVLDGYNRIRRVMECGVDTWSFRELFEALAFYRDKGYHDADNLGYSSKPLYNLLVNELNEQIRREDPEWFKGRGPLAADGPREGAREADAPEAEAPEEPVAAQTPAGAWHIVRS